MPGGAPFRTSKRVSANNASAAMTALATTNAITSSFANAHIIIASCRSAGDRSIAASLVCWWFQSNQASTILQPNTLSSQHDFHLELLRYEIAFRLDVAVETHPASPIRHRFGRPRGDPLVSRSTA